MGVFHFLFALLVAYALSCACFLGIKRMVAWSALLGAVVAAMLLVLLAIGVGPGKMSPFAPTLVVGLWLPFGLTAVATASLLSALPVGRRASQAETLAARRRERRRIVLVEVGALFWFVVILVGALTLDGRS